MIELFLDLIITGVFELFADLLIGGRDGEQQPQRQQHERGSRGTLWAKIALGVGAGLAWGYYVGQERDGWPGTFWTFSAVGLATWAMSASQFSNEEWAVGVERDALRKLVTFTPDRFGNWAIFSGATAAAIAAGYFLAG